MESNRFLGIAIGRHQAALVCMDARSSEAEITECILVHPQQGTAETPSLAAAIGQAIRSKGLIYDEAAVALGSDFYAQYPLHSMFSEYRQIENTIKFDAEEATAADATTLAITFEILRAEDKGSEVMVYSADRQSLTDILMDLQAEGIDPVMMEPDVVSLARGLDKKCEFAQDLETLYVILDADSYTLLKNANKGRGAYSRRILFGSQTDHTAELARQLQLTLAAWSFNEPIRSIVLAGQTGQIDGHALSRQVGRPVEKKDLSLPDGGHQTGSILAAAAWGAALIHVTRGRKADFREDFMPFQGRRKILQKSLRIMSVSLTVVLLVIAAYYQLKTFRMYGCTRQLEGNLIAEYKEGMGQNPPSNMSIITKLKSVQRQAKQRQAGYGPGEDNSVVAKLTYVLEAINDTQKSVDVVVQQIAVTERTLRVQGDTNGRRSTMQVFDEMKKHPKLEIESSRVDPSPPRGDEFEVTLVVPEQGGS